MNIRFFLVIAALFLSCYAGNEAAGQTPASDSKQTWRGKIPPSGIVEIVGIAGDIHTETTAGDEVDIVALKEGEASELDQVRMQVEESAGGLKICAAFPLLKREGKSECIASKKFNSTNFTGGELHLGSNDGFTQSFRLADFHLHFRVRLPAGAQLVASTLRGNIEALGISAKAQLRATNGSVTANLGTPDFSGAVDLKTINGGVRLTAPDKLNAQVQLDTMNGEIATDYPITVAGGFHGSYLAGNIGRGGQMLSLSTLNGDVEIRRARGPAESGSRILPETKPNEFKWSGKVPPDGLVEIVGIAGDIHTEVSAGDEVEVIAIREGKKDEIDQIQIHVEESAVGVRICAAFPLLEGGGQSECLAGEKLKNTAIFSDGGSQKLYLGYESGKKQNIRVDDLKVQFKVRIPGGTQFNAEARLEAPYGEVATDFPMRVQGRLPARSLVGTIGQGGQKLTLRTLFGNVTLRRGQ